eukprot:185223-Karenia_brevis.AAC.1
MQETGELRYISWRELTSRDAELRGDKTEDIIVQDAEGRLKKTNRKIEAPVDLSSESRWKYALQRRGIALQMAHLATYKCHQQVVLWLERELMRDPLPGYSRPTLDQIKRADFEIFSRAAELLEEDLSIRTDATLPLDSVIPRILVEPRIQALMMPLPTASGSKRNNEDEVERLREQVKYLKGSTKGNGKSGNKSGKGKASKSRRGGKSVNMPAELLALNCAPTVGGQRACFAFNLQGCDRGNACPYGVHKCMIKGCGSTAHGAKNHE